MSSDTDQVADVECDLEVIDLPEDSKIDKGSGYWGDMSKYTDEDFDHLIPRLVVPSLVKFVKSANTQTALAKLVIQNTSNLPMTYSIQDLDARILSIQSQNPKVRVTKPERGWIPPKSSALLNIRTHVDDDSLHVRHFALRAAPIFREKHTQKENLELFWEAFDSECVPLPEHHVEEHIFTVYTSSKSNPFQELLHVKPPKYFRNNQGKISEEEFETVWWARVAGEDEQDYKFALQLYLRELRDRVGPAMKRTAEAKLSNTMKKSLIFLLIGMIFGVLSCVLQIVKWKYSNKEPHCHCTPMPSCTCNSTYFDSKDLKDDDNY